MSSHTQYSMPVAAEGMAGVVRSITAGPARRGQPIFLIGARLKTVLINYSAHGRIPDVAEQKICIVSM